jgi:uncharacterized cofD-like protein
VLGPGSLYTSILPNLLVDGVVETIRDSRALRIFVCNLMTQPGETDGFDALDHLRVVERYLGEGSIDVCVINGRSPQGATAARYTAMGSEEVRWSSAALASAGTQPIVADLLTPDQFPYRHDPEKLADVVLCLARGIIPDRLQEGAGSLSLGLGAAEPALTWGPREMQILAELP